MKRQSCLFQCPKNNSMTKYLLCQLALATVFLFSTHSYSAEQLGTDIDILSTDFGNSEQVEYIQVWSYSEDDWGDPQYNESALITTSPYYLKNGFTVELDLVRLKCIFSIEQRLVIDGHGFLLGEITHLANKDGCWFKSDYFNEEFLVSDAQIRIAIDNEGVISFSQGSQVAITSDTKLDMDLFEIAYPAVQFDQGNLAAFRLSTPANNLGEEAKNLIGQNFFDNFYAHPAGLGVNQTASDEFSHKVWTIAFTDKDLSPYYNSQHYITHYNTNFVFHPNNNNLNIVEQLQEIWTAQDENVANTYVIRTCLEETCPAINADDVDFYYGLKKPSYIELSQWEPLGVTQNQQNAFSFEIPYLFRLIYERQYAQSIELIMREEYTQQEQTLYSLALEDLFPEWDGTYSKLVEINLHSDDPIQFYLKVCNTVNCYDSALSTIFSAKMVDTDSDGIPDYEDADIDNDGYPNELDPFPLDVTEWSDLDGDGQGDNSDPDIDGDGVQNEADAFPLDSGEWIDTDNDGLGNNADPDIDNDGFLNEDDLFPLDASEWTDLDGDGIGDNSDPDVDGDGLDNETDPEPYEFNFNVRQDDRDYDGLSDDLELALGFDPEVANNLRLDSDYDGFSDLVESLVGSALNDSNETPIELGYLESFENGLPTLINLTQAEQLHSTGSVQGNLSYWLELNNANEVQVEEIQYQGHIGNGYLIFSSYSDTIDEALDVELAVYNTHWGFNNDEQQHRVYLGDGVTLFFLPVRNDNSKTTKLKINLTISQPTAVDMFYFPVSEACRLSQRNPGMPDFNCDGKADPALQRGNYADSWLYKDTDTLLNDGNSITNAGNALLFSHGDFDGDGISDAILRTNDMHWRIDYSSYGKSDTVSFGLDVNDIPVIGDYDGDGISDIAVRRPRTGMWYVKRSSDNEIGRIRFGRFSDDIPVPADYDGDGITDVAVKRKSNSTWYIRQSSNGETRRVTFGKQPGDIEVPADYDGDGKDDIAIRRPYFGEWIVLQSSNGQIVKTRFGSRENDIPAPADYDGDGKADFAIKRVENGMWYILRSTDNEIQHFHFSTDRYDIPLTAPPILRWQVANGDYSFMDSN